MKRAVTMWLAALLALSLTACGGGASGGGEADASSSAGGGESLSFSAEESQNSAPAEPGAEAESASPQAGQNAKLIRRAELEIQTEAFDAAAASLEALVAEAGGYFQSAQVEGGSLRDQNAARYGNYVIRLPEENFSAFLDQSGTLGYVVRRSESSENVSQAYYDTETRLAAQRTKQERLLALLAQADTMESIIELENALSETEYEIQSLTTDLEHYDDLIDYATVDLYLAEVLSLSQTPGETAGLGERMAAGLSASAAGLVQGVQDLLVWLSYHLFPVIVVLGAAGGGLFYWRRVRRGRKDGTPEEKQP